MNDGQRIIRNAYKELFEEVSAILFRHDPIEINFGSNTDEYDPEAGTIIPRLRDAGSEDDILDIVHEEFVRWFGSDITGERDAYQSIAADIMAAWKRWRNTPDTDIGPDR